MTDTDSPYRSRFGGLWTDRADARERAAERAARGEITAEQAELVEHWIENGYVILPGAVDHAPIDALNAEIEEAWRVGDRSIRIEVVTQFFDLSPELRREKVKLLDLYVRSEAARRIAFAKPIRDFLALVFESTPMAFQGLYFDHGTEQPMHQDTAYVRVDAPMELAASWVACEDVERGAGELLYYPKSHRFPEFVFPDERKHWNMAADGMPVHDRYLDHLHGTARERGIGVARFCPKKGDALIWSADLAHGGGPVTRAGSTRRSLVCHYSPEHRRPGYFDLNPEHAVRKWHASGAWYASDHYTLEPD